MYCVCIDIDNLLDWERDCDVTSLRNYKAYERTDGIQNDGMRRSVIIIFIKINLILLFCMFIIWFTFICVEKILNCQGYGSIYLTLYSFCILLCAPLYILFFAFSFSQGSLKLSYRFWLSVPVIGSSNRFLFGFAALLQCNKSMDCDKNMGKSVLTSAAKRWNYSNFDFPQNCRLFIKKL